MENKKESLENKCERYYVRFGTMLKNNPEIIKDLSVESFIIEGALQSFADAERYDICKLITDFKNSNPEKIIEISKEDYFKRLK